MARNNFIKIEQMMEIETEKDHFTSNEISSFIHQDAFSPEDIGDFFFRIRY